MIWIWDIICASVSHHYFGVGSVAGEIIIMGTIEVNSISFPHRDRTVESKSTRDVSHFQFRISQKYIYLFPVWGRLPLLRYSATKEHFRVHSSYWCAGVQQHILHFFSNYFKNNSNWVMGSFQRSYHIISTFWHLALVHAVCTVHNVLCIMHTDWSNLHSRFVACDHT